MYPNKYYVEMKIATRLSSAFNLNELQILENARIRHNNYLVNASNRQTKNRQYNSLIITKGDIIGFYLETEYPVSNIQRIGNALRMYAIMSVDNGFGVYVANQRLMRAAQYRKKVEIHLLFLYPFLRRWCQKVVNVKSCALSN